MLDFEERAHDDGSLELHARADDGSRLFLRGLAEEDEDARLGARILLELLDAARSHGGLHTQDDTWVIATAYGAIPLTVTEGLIVSAGGEAPRQLTDLEGDGGPAPTKAIATALTVTGLMEVDRAPLVAKEAFERSLRVHDGAPERADDVGDRFGNHNNHKAWLGLAKVAAKEGDHAEADRCYRECLLRSWTAQMRTVGGRLERIEVEVPPDLLVDELERFVTAAMDTYDRSREQLPSKDGVAVIPSPVFTFGERGQAVQQLLPVPEAWVGLYFEGAAREKLTERSTLELIAEALTTHHDDVVPLARTVMGSPLFDATRSAREMEMPVEYLPPFQLWTSVVATVGHWAAAGLSDAEIRAGLLLDDAPERRAAALQKWEDYQLGLEEDARHLYEEAPS